MRRTLVIIALLLFPVLSIVSGQATGVTAEAINQANMRARPDVNSEQVGEIQSGTTYPVIGRSEFFPWVLLGDPATAQPIGWVFQDLLNITGNLVNVPISTLDVSAPPPTTLPTATVAQQQAPPQTDTDEIIVTPFVPTASPTPRAAVTGTTRGEINVRYGPGVDYAALGRAFAGDIFEITATHSQFPWVQVRYDNSPTGHAWIAESLLDIQGNLFSLPVITDTQFNLPTLTPTPAVGQAIRLPGQQAVEISPGFRALGDAIWNQVLEAGFVPEGSRFGALYLQDLQTGEAITFGSDFAFSGTSTNKIAVLASYYATLDRLPNLQEAIDIPKTMICSQNVATNELLSIVGGNGNYSDDYLGGAEITTGLLRDLGLQRTFLTAPFDARPRADIQPTAPPRPVEIPQTDADQSRANPNPANQMTVDEIGLLLSSMYECAYQGSGPLIDNFDGAFTPQECRHMLHVMSSNRVDAFIKAGVPENVRVAHKHGWIADTHTNAAVVFTPGGDFVMVMALHQPEFIAFPETLPLMANAARTVYNYYNPDQPLDAPREGFIPEANDCPYNSEHPLVGQLMNPGFQRDLDPALFYQPDAVEPEATVEPGA